MFISLLCFVKFSICRCVTIIKPKCLTKHFCNLSPLVIWTKLYLFFAKTCVSLLKEIEKHKNYGEANTKQREPKKTEKQAEEATEQTKWLSHPATFFRRRSVPGVATSLLSVPEIQVSFWFRILCWITVEKPNLPKRFLETWREVAAWLQKLCKIRARCSMLMIP